VKKSFNIKKLLHHKSKHHETKPMHPFSLRAFQRDQECNLKHPGLVDLISTNKLPCFIDRFYMQLVKKFMWKFGNLNTKWEKKEKNQCNLFFKFLFDGGLFLFLHYYDIWVHFLEKNPSIFFNTISIKIYYNMKNSKLDPSYLGKHWG